MHKDSIIIFIFKKTLSELIDYHNTTLFRSILFISKLVAEAIVAVSGHHKESCGVDNDDGPK